MGPKSNDQCFLSTDTVLFKQGHREIHRQDGNVETKAETGAVLPQAKEHQELPEARRGKGGFSPKDFRGSTALEYLDFGRLTSSLLTSRTVRGEISVL